MALGDPDSAAGPATATGISRSETSSISSSALTSCTQKARSKHKLQAASVPLEESAGRSWWSPRSTTRPCFSSNTSNLFQYYAGS